MRTLVICLSILCVGCFALALPVHGADGVLSTQPNTPPRTNPAPTPSMSRSPVTLDVKDASVLDLIDSVFKGRQLNYSIDQAIGAEPYSRARVSITLSGVSFEEALNAICREAGIQYLVSNGVYMFRPHPLLAIGDTSGAIPANAPYGAASDSKTYADSVAYTLPAGSPASAPPIGRDSNVTLAVKDANPCDLLVAVFRGRQMNFSIDPRLKEPPYSTVHLTLSLTGVPFETALKSICKVANIVYRIENNVFMFGPHPGAVEDWNQKEINYTFRAGEQLEPALNKMWKTYWTDSPHEKAIASGKYDKTPVPSARFFRFPAGDIDKWMTYEAHRPHLKKPDAASYYEPLPDLSLRMSPPSDVSVGAVYRDGKWVVTFASSDYDARDILVALLDLVGTGYTEPTKTEARFINSRACGIPLEEAIKNIAEAGNLVVEKRGSMYFIGTGPH